MDERERVVGCRGKGRFTWVGKDDGGNDNGGRDKESSWDEVFLYRLEYAEEERTVEEEKVRLVKRYEVWADSGAMERAAGVSKRVHG